MVWQDFKLKGERMESYSSGRFLRFPCRVNFLRYSVIRSWGTSTKSSATHSLLVMPSYSTLKWTLPLVLLTWCTLLKSCRSRLLTCGFPGRLRLLGFTSLWLLSDFFTRSIIVCNLLPYLLRACPGYVRWRTRWCVGPCLTKQILQIGLTTPNLGLVLAGGRCIVAVFATSILTEVLTCCLLRSSPGYVRWRTRWCP